MHFLPARRGAAQSLLVIALAAGCAASAGAAADARNFTTTGGAVVEFEPVAGLDCRRLDRKLAEIDRTGYRGSRPAPLRVEDEPLFIYERKVAKALYTRCAQRAAEGDAGKAMRAGRWAQEKSRTPVGATR
ncbi:hypothetical protein ACQ5SO_15995 [Rhodovulum sp. DZ06]|uniref:hypothetical protein n=1 Tax=Rhodovulum sp. DZ06 TaxID=3425126 RepID=UPI003D332E2D